MGDIKSAREIAMEKVGKLSKATDDERLRWKYIPEGERLAARYTTQDCNLAAELSQYDEKVTKYVIDGAVDILARNINLPKDDLTRKNNKKAMDGLKTLKNDKVGVENVYTKIRHIFDHHMQHGEQQKKQAYESLKAEVETKMQQAIQQQLGQPMKIKIEAERQPQFQEEWRRIQAQLDSQYLKLLDEYKQELLNIV
ncbi:hypothetical protein ACFLYI_01160 [Chloroflexota bacterium]